jgi:hypothetical protein
MKKHWSLWWRKNWLALSAAIGVTGGIAGMAALAQQPGMSLINATLIGHLINGGSGTTAQPTLTNCTAAGPISDTDGQCTATSTTITVTFAQPWATAPYCIAVDATSAATVPQFTYTTSTTALTVSTMTSGHTAVWHCGSRIGG